MTYEFINKSECDERAKFANAVCQLLVDSHRKDITEALANVKPLFDHFHEHVRNVYELIDTEIPLFALHELMTLPADNWGFSEEEHYNAKLRTLKACNQYYRLEMRSIVEWESKNL